MNKKNRKSKRKREKRHINAHTYVVTYHIYHVYEIRSHVKSKLRYRRCISCFQPITIFPKKYILYVWVGSENGSGYESQRKLVHAIFTQKFSKRIVSQWQFLRILRIFSNDEYMKMRTKQWIKYYLNSGYSRQQFTTSFLLQIPLVNLKKSTDFCGFFEIF